MDAVTTGLEIRDASGALVMSTSDWIGIALGFVEVGAVAGHVDNATFGLGRPFAVAIGLGGATAYQPIFSFDATLNRLSWTFPSITPSPVASFRILYGTY